MRPALVGVVGYWARRALGVPVQSTTTDKEKPFSLSVSALVDLATAKKRLHQRAGSDEYQ